MFRKLSPKSLFFNWDTAGDRILRLMGETLKKNSENSPRCRLGGDEFLLFARNVSAGEAEARVQKIIHDFDEKKADDPE